MIVSNKNMNTPETVHTEIDDGREGYSALEIAVFMFLLSAVAVIISLLFFLNGSLRLDEAQSLWQTSRSVPAMMNLVAQDVHVPLYHIMLHYWQVLFGNSVPTGRILSLIFFILLIPATYVLGSRAYSKTTGLFAALLVAVSPFLSWYGNEIRMYTLFALFTILNQYFFTRIFMDGTNEKDDVPISVWIGYAITAIGGIFTHYFFAFTLVAQALFFFMYRKDFPRKATRNFAIVAVLIVAAFSPWLYIVVHLGSAANTQPALTRPSSIDVFNTFAQFMFGFQDDRTNSIILSLWPIVVLLIFLSIRRNRKVEPQTIYLFLCVAVPIVLAFAVSYIWKPIYLTRYLTLTLPSLYLLVSWVLSTYPLRLERWLKLSLVIVMISTLSIEAISAKTPVKEDYRAAADYISAHATPEDVIVLSAPFTVYPFEYYYNGPVLVQTLPIWNQYAQGPIPAYSPTELAADAATLQDSHQTVWLLLSYDQGYEESVRLYYDSHFQRIDAKSFSPDLTLYAYKLRYDSVPLSTALRYIRENPVLNSGLSSDEATTTATSSVR